MRICVVIVVCIACFLSGSLMAYAQASTKTEPEAEPTPKVVCHEGQTTFIDDEELQNHLDHGDTQGACSKVSGGSGSNSENEGGEKPEKVTICHKDKHTLSIAEPAVQAHLAHGDTQGACPDSPKKHKNPSSSKDQGNDDNDDNDDDDDGQNSNGQEKIKQDKSHKREGKGKS